MIKFQNGNHASTRRIISNFETSKTAVANISIFKPHFAKILFYFLSAGKGFTQCNNLQLVEAISKSSEKLFLFQRNKKKIILYSNKVIIMIAFINLVHFAVLINLSTQHRADAEASKYFEMLIIS